ncbi:MAG: hypothetical protein WCH93_09800, partial [Actinomycetota bacterium]
MVHGGQLRARAPPRRACVCGRGREIWRGLEATEEVRLLEDDRRRVDRRAGHVLRIGHTVGVRDLDDLKAEARRVGLHDLPHLRARRLGDDDLAAPICAFDRQLGRAMIAATRRYSRVVQIG